jgi:rod shape-determining protein MreC
MKTPSNRSTQAAIITLVAVGLIALSLGGYLSPLSRAVLSPFVSVQTWVSTRYQALLDVIRSPNDLARLKQRNTELEAEVSRLQAQVLDLQQQITDEQVLAALLKFARSHPDNQYLAANVIGYDTSPFVKYVLINRGSDDGLRRGMPVATTDPASHINVRLQPSGAEGILSGSLTGELSLENIPQDATVEAGALVLTSGLGGNYPSNIPIGQVNSVRQRSFDLFQTAVVQSLVDFNKLDIVLVITNFKPIDLEPLIP